MVAAAVSMAIVLDAEAEAVSASIAMVAERALLPVAVEGPLEV